jgi:hypothetical protein
MGGIHRSGVIKVKAGQRQRALRSANGTLLKRGNDADDRLQNRSWRGIS